MSAVHKRGHSAPADPLELLSTVAQSGRLEDSVRLCLEAICSETGCTAISLTGIAALAFGPELKLVGGHPAKLNGAARRHGAGIFRDGAEAHERPIESPSASEARQLPLLMGGVEIGSIVLHSARRRLLATQTRRLNAWLGLLALLAQAGQAAQGELPRGCLSMDWFVRHLERECQRSQTQQRPLSLIALARAHWKAAENGEADDGGSFSLFQAATQLKERLRLSDTIGLDERRLWCLLPDTDALEAKIALAQMEKGLPSPESTAPPAPTERRWVGAMVTFPEDGVSAEQLMGCVTDRLSLAATGD